MIPPAPPQTKQSSATRYWVRPSPSACLSVVCGACGVAVAAEWSQPQNDI